MSEAGYSREREPGPIALSPSSANTLPALTLLNLCPAGYSISIYAQLGTQSLRSIRSLPFNASLAGSRDASPVANKKQKEMTWMGLKGEEMNPDQEIDIALGNIQYPKDLRQYSKYGHASYLVPLASYAHGSGRNLSYTGVPFRLVTTMGDAQDMCLFLYSDVNEIEFQWGNFIRLMDAGAEDDLDPYRLACLARSDRPCCLLERSSVFLVKLCTHQSSLGQVTAADCNTALYGSPSDEQILGSMPDTKCDSLYTSLFTALGSEHTDCLCYLIERLSGYCCCSCCDSGNSTELICCRKLLSELTPILLPPFFGEIRRSRTLQSPTAVKDGEAVTQGAIWITLYLMKTWSVEEREKYVIHGALPEGFSMLEYCAKSRNELQAVLKVARTAPEIQAYVTGASTDSNLSTHDSNWLDVSIAEDMDACSTKKVPDSSDRDSGSVGGDISDIMSELSMISETCSSMCDVLNAVYFSGKIEAASGAGMTDDEFYAQCDPDRVDVIMGAQAEGPAIAPADRASAKKKRQSKRGSPAAGGIVKEYWE